MELFYAIQIYAIARGAIDMEFSTVFKFYSEDASKMKRTLEEFAHVVLHDAAQDIKLGHSYGMFDEIVAQYYNIK